jgi:hypothetical protein
MYVNCDNWAYVAYYKEKHKILLIVTKEVGEEVNINKTKYMILSGVQDKGRIKNKDW